MSPFGQQLAKEARYDVIVASVGLALFLGCGLILPRSWFWYWFTPMAAFWFRYLWVRCRRDEVLERLDAETTPPAPGCYPLEGGGVVITDGVDHLVIGQSRPEAPHLPASPEPQRLGQPAQLLLGRPIAK